MNIKGKSVTGRMYRAGIQQYGFWQKILKSRSWAQCPVRLRSTVTVEFTGAEQAVADINAKGGIKGNKLQIVKYDDACDPKQAVAVANKVVNDGIKYVDWSPLFFINAACV